MMDQAMAREKAFFGASRAPFRKSQGTPCVRPDMRYVLLLILIGLLVFLSNQLWILFVGAPLF
jgi:hypothetical protein